MENTKKVILLLFIILFSCQNKNKFSLIKENLYKGDDGQIVLKISNKKVRHPSKDIKWKDTIYQSHFRFENMDSIINLKDVIDVKTFKIISPDIYFEDKNYIYINAYYKPGENQYKIIRKDSSTIFIDKDSLKVLKKIYLKGNLIH